MKVSDDRMEGIEMTDEMRELLRDLLEANEETKDLSTMHLLRVYDAPLVNEINTEPDSFNFIPKVV